MDCSYVKHAPALPVLLPSGRLVYLAPLSPSTTERLIIDCRLELQAHGLSPFDPGMVMLVARRTLELVSGEDLAHELYPQEQIAMVSAWGRHQRRCHPSESRLSEWLRRRVNDDPDVLRDGWRAQKAKTAAEYYGRPTVDLTDGQVAYWQILSSAFTEFHVGVGGRRKAPTKEWLQRSE